MAASAAAHGRCTNPTISTSATICADARRQPYDANTDAERVDTAARRHVFARRPTAAGTSRECGIWPAGLCSAAAALP